MKSVEDIERNNTSNQFDHLGDDSFGGGKGVIPDRCSEHRHAVTELLVQMKSLDRSKLEEERKIINQR